MIRKYFVFLHHEKDYFVEMFMIKLKYIITSVMMLFCFSVFGQQQKSVLEAKQDTQAIEETISQLQAENYALHNRVDEMERNLEICRGDLRTKVAEMDEAQGRWLTILSIVMGLIGVGLGVVAPVFLNYRNERNIEKMLSDAKQEAFSAKEQAEKAEMALNNIKSQVDSVKNQAISATNQAEQAKKAVVEIEELKKHVDAIEKKIDEDADAAEKAALSAKISQLFTKAYSMGVKDRLKAIELYSEVIKLNPNIEEAYNNRGAMYCEMGDYVKAVEDANHAIEINSDHASAYNNKAFALMKIGDLDRALELVNVAIEKENGVAAYWDTKGEICLNMGKYEEAIRLYTKALSLNENFKQSIANRANCYRKMAEMEDNMVKRAEWIALAEADDKKVDSL